MLIHHGQRLPPDLNHAEKKVSTTQQGVWPWFKLLASSEVTTAGVWRPMNISLFSQSLSILQACIEPYISLT